MKKSLSLVSIGFLVVLFTACPSKKASKSDSAPLFFPVISDAKFQMPKKHSVHIDSVFIEKDVLNLKINYSGGCKAHYFQLLTNGSYAKSIPPQLNVFLNDTVTSDACRQYKEETIKFDVTKLKHASQKAVLIKFGDGVEVKYSY